MDVFLLKKVVSNLVHVVPGAFFVLLVCIVLLRGFPRTARFGLLIMSASLLALSSPPASNTVVDGLENRYAVVQALPADTALVIVLGLGHHWTADRPPNSVLMAGALSRVSEGVRLWKTAQEAHLMLSGAKFRSEISHAEAMSNMALEQGVSASQIVLVPDARDTREEINAAVQWMKSNSNAAGRLVVVSSAMHLSRAAAMLGEQDFAYTMAPTDFRKLDAPWYRFHSYHLNNVDWAVHEYVGILWNHLTD